MDRPGDEFKGTKEELELRQLLWLHHGCDCLLLYGDDGELQCHNTKHSPLGIDFRRDSVELITWKLGNDWYKKAYCRPER